MGFIKEPEGVDFVVQSKRLTDKQEKELSEFIAKRKLEIKKRSKKAHTHNRVSQGNLTPDLSHNRSPIPGTSSTFIKFREKLIG